jgi:hypothetical protein
METAFAVIGASASRAAAAIILRFIILSIIAMRPAIVSIRALLMSFLVIWIPEADRAIKGANTASAKMTAL